MSLPRVLLVDDSEAVLAYASASLAGLYDITTAVNGREGLEKMRAVRPEIVLLDLSMPEMNGVEALERMQADRDLATIPVVVVSSEGRRAQDCLGRGAASFLEKPVRAEALRATVAAVLEAARRRRLEGGLGVLFLEVGALKLGLPLDCVRLVALQPATSALPMGAPYLREMIDLQGEPVYVLDMAARFGSPFAAPRAERKLVVIRHGARSLALCVDRVHDPEEVPPEQLVPASRVAGAEAAQLEGLLRAIVLTAAGPVAVLEPAKLIGQDARPEGIVLPLVAPPRPAALDRGR
jgi:CheY-like chemotaxis protein/chemotaxis signal transduction protein